MDAILGSDEEMDEETATEILQLYGITGSQLLEGFKLRLNAELRKHHEETNEVSKPLSAVLQSVREQQRQSESESVTFQSYIANFLNNPMTHNTETYALYSFHKLQEGEVSEEDKNILDELRAELENDEEEKERT